MANVTGPASSTDTAIARWDGTSGTMIQDSTVTVDGSGNFSGVAALNDGATATTQTQGDNSTSIATTAYVDTGLSALSLDSLSDVYYDDSSTHNLIIGQKVTLAAGAIQNVFIGELAGATAANSTSDTQANTAVGRLSMSSLTSGSGNSALGTDALSSINSGNSNVGIGVGAAANIVGGSYNTAVGTAALGGADSDSNTAIGSAALPTVTGSHNIGLGVGTGSILTTGSNNILIGDAVDVPTATTSNYLNIGDAIT